MDFYTLTAIKFALGILMMIFQINILGKRDFSLNTPLNQVQNYVLGGIIGGVIYNSSITLLQFLIIILIWSLVVVATKILIDTSKTFKKLAACQPELLIRDGKVDIARCAKVGLTAQGLSRSLREHGVSSVADIEAAIMETNGSLTIRARDDGARRSLLPLVSDGQMVSDGLALAGRDAAWVKEQLKAQGYSSVKQVFLGELVDGKLEVVPFSKAAKLAQRETPRGS
ncbi:DUF421 domain-containing protein [Schaalia meyeri]|uniref:DUF421 domain-containing protein n=1 Tax=Schaalia meyeri TaxID=52773 RepID=A0AAP9Y928_9ACTO|nr:YetF domain-containing protein [Schaalia meyeri]OFQ23166.1 hypothetical protein HMPREF2946_09065 [Actinomyces sp. HMSC062G12]QQC43998.1 DUF421 domain-containing protein [Schaalia meyeri]SDR66172.1 Uncharacterized membrane protein YcaP, DUF421 family [Schaalia meyeri]